jgi:hypothetical protein
MAENSPARKSFDSCIRANGIPIASRLNDEFAAKEDPMRVLNEN